MNVRDVDPAWLACLNGLRVCADVDVLGVVARADGWATVDGEAFGINDLEEIAQPGRSPRCDDPDDMLSFAFGECHPAIDPRGWLNQTTGAVKDEAA